MVLLATSIFLVLIIIAVFGIGLWALNTYVPMTAGIKRLINIVAIVGLIVWLMRVFGAWDYLFSVKV